MKGCLNYTKEASRHRLQFPELNRRSRIILIGGCICLVVLLLWIFWPQSDKGFLVTSPQALAVENSETAASADAATEVSSASTPSVVEVDLVVVYVTGAVAKPGVYQLIGGARIDDGVQAAGGFIDTAATDFVNLAAPLLDGQQIHIPTREEIAAGAPQPMGTVTSSSSSNQGMSMLVNINTADSDLLQTLPGIGPATAQRIIAYRDAHGNFSSPDELKQVSGIGEKKYAALVDLICV
jgi:competence protein ComEA